MGKKNGIKFKDTAIFKTIKNIAPEVLDTVTDIAATIYPPLGVVNNLVDKALGVAKKNNNESGAAMIHDAKEKYASELEMYYKDMESARGMYKETEHEMADSIADNVIKRNLIFVAILVIVQVLVVMYVEDKTVIAVISSVIGGVITALLQERQQVINFFFGSSKGSKDKDTK
jgi:hypothetical protein